MSRAFVKEDGGEPWTPPPAARAYRLTWRGPGGPETIRETDDLLEALRWLGERDRSGRELRGQDGALLGRGL